MLWEYHLTETANDHIGLAKAIQAVACQLERGAKLPPMRRKQVRDAIVVRLIASAFGTSMVVAARELYEKTSNLPREKEQ